MSLEFLCAKASNLCCTVAEGCVDSQHRATSYMYGMAFQDQRCYKLGELLCWDLIRWWYTLKKSIRTSFVGGKCMEMPVFTISGAYAVSSKICVRVSSKTMQNPRGFTQKNNTENHVILMNLTKPCKTMGHSLLLLMIFLTLHIPDTGLDWSLRMTKCLP